VFKFGGFFLFNPPFFFQKVSKEPVDTLFISVYNYTRMNNNGKIGRPKGAKSTIEITLADLLMKVGSNPNAVVHVGSTWFAKYSSYVIASSSQQDSDTLPPEIQKQLDEAEKIEFTVSQ